MINVLPRVYKGVDQNYWELEGNNADVGIENGSGLFSCGTLKGLANRIRLLFSLSKEWN